MSRQPRDRRRARWGWALVALGVAMWLAGLGGLALRANRCLADVRLLAGQAAQLQDFVQAYGQSTLTSPESVSSMYQALRVMDAELGDLAGQGAPFLALSPYLAWWPAYGPDVQAAPGLLAMARGLLTTGVVVTGLMQGAPGDGTALAVRANEGALEAARAALDRATAARAEIDAGRVSPQVRRSLETFDRVAPVLDMLLRAGRLAPYLIGLDRPQTYLLLAQSEDELRPTGGFITAVGRLRVERGRVTELSLGDSYAVDDPARDYPYPPWPLYEYMGADMWLLRDANWSPDFPTSAETAAALARVGTGVDVDGVIAVDQRTLQYILAAVGPVEVEGKDGIDRVTADNITGWMQAQWSPVSADTQNREWWLQRKTFVGDLAGALRRKLEVGGQLDAVALAEGLARALGEKHLLIYSRDPRAAALLAEYGWDGRIAQGPGDYLSLVEANVGFNKASPMIERKVNYRVALDGTGGGDAAVTVRYRHTGTQRVDFCEHVSRYDPVYADQMNRCYWSYVRLVAPAPAELEVAPRTRVAGQNLVRGRASKDTVDPERVGDARQSWGQLVLLAPGQSIDLDYRYRLPAADAPLNDGLRQYRLLVQKQPGLRDLPVSAEVTLPAGARLAAADPRPAGVAGSVVRFDLDLVKDQVIQLDYRP